MRTAPVVVALFVTLCLVSSAQGLSAGDVLGAFTPHAAKAPAAAETQPAVSKKQTGHSEKVDALLVEDFKSMQGHQNVVLLDLHMTADKVGKADPAAVKPKMTSGPMWLDEDHPPAPRFESDRFFAAPQPVFLQQMQMQQMQMHAQMYPQIQPQPQYYQAVPMYAVPMQQMAVPVPQPPRPAAAASPSAGKPEQDASSTGAAETHRFKASEKATTTPIPPMMTTPPLSPYMNGMNGAFGPYYNTQQLQYMYQQPMQQPYYRMQYYTGYMPAAPMMPTYLPAAPYVTPSRLPPGAAGVGNNAGEAA